MTHPIDPALPPLSASFLCFRKGNRPGACQRPSYSASVSGERGSEWGRDHVVVALLARDTLSRGRAEMRYFELTASTDAGITGTLPQVRFAEIIGRDEPCDEVVTYVRHLDSDPVFKGSKQPGALHTDLMSCAGLSPGKGLLVSDRFRTLAEAFDCAGCRSYPFHIRDPETGATAVHHFLHIVSCREWSDSIDYPRSRFATTAQPGAVKISGWQDWWDRNLAQVSHSAGIITATALFLKTSRVPGLVRMPFSAAIFVSEELKERIARENLSGFSFGSVDLGIVPIASSSDGFTGRG